MGGHFALPMVAPDVVKYADWVVRKVTWGKVFRADGNVDPFVLLDPGVKVCIVVIARTQERAVGNNVRYSRRLWRQNSAALYLQQLSRTKSLSSIISGMWTTILWRDSPI